MKRLLLGCVCLLICIQLNVLAAETCRRYRSPNKQLVAEVQIIHHSNQPLPESVVSIYNSHDKLLQHKSYISPDHEHGFSVVQLQWSADSKFCVWSLTSSGGHSPWHFPTDCYIQKCKAIVNIDMQLNCGLTLAKFSLQAPHIFLSERLISNPQGEPEYAKITFDLADLKCH